MDFLTRLLDSSEFVPRRHGEGGTPELVWLHNLADGLIGLSYLVIPLVLVVFFLRRRRDVPSPWLFGLFAAFLVAGGLTHLLDVVVTYVPVYRLVGAVKLATALLAVATVIALVSKLPRALMQRSAGERVAAEARDPIRAEREEAKLRERERRLQALSDIAAHLLAAPDPATMASGLARLLDDRFGLQVTLRLPDETAGPAADDRDPAQGVGVRACAIYPIRADDAPVGTVAFTSRSQDQFDPDETAFFQTVAWYTAVVYERLRAVARLRDADRKKDEFLATLAHELRNPIAPIANALQVLRLAGNNPGMVEQARGMMERQMRQVVRLIDDLLDASRISRGKLALRREPTDLAAVVAAAVETSRPLIEASGHRLDVALPPEPLRLAADATRLAQVFANVLNNAAKYTPAGGQIRLSAERDGGTAVVRVRDSGIGIPADRLPQIFELFVQVDSSVGRAQGGLGIGLALVKGLVEMHGGTVAAHSDGPGTGSEFVVRLPLTATAAAPAPRAARPEAAPAAIRCRVLVADDNDDAAVSLRLLLESMGAEVRTANDGLEAVAAAEAFRPDLAFLDIRMPLLDGNEAARRIRAQPWGRTIVLVALTGRSHEEDRRRAEQAGFDHHVLKPLDPAALDAVLRRFRRPS
ncbi:MAG: ATP-binding protein [Gemmataceae bacterium]